MNRISFHQLFSALPSPHMILDRDLKFAAVNHAYEIATMQGEADLVGRHVFEAFPNDGEAGRRLQTSFDRVLQTGEPDTLAYVEYDIPRPEELGGGTEKRYWTAVHSPLFDQAGEVMFILQNTVDITEIVRLRAAATLPFQVLPGEVALVQRAREVEEAYKETVNQTEAFQRLFELSPGMVALLQGPDHIFTFANTAYRAFVGPRDLLGLPVRDALPDIAGQIFFDMLDQVYQTGEAQIASDTRVLISDGTSAMPREAFIDLSYHPIRDRQGAVSGIFVQAYDRTDAVRSHHRQRLLIDELNHRVKNTLSTVQSLARRSFRTNADREDARRVFEARILALSNAHNLLSEQHWQSADLETILRLELGAFGDDRFELHGLRVTLSPKAAIALAIVFHELSSNAVKYGALSQAGGLLRIGWAYDGQELVFRWHETPLPEGAQPTPGFGMRMLERIITGELEGNLQVDFGSGSLTWMFRLKRTEIEDLGQTAYD
ncbi:sensor histidine kinase [Aureimonas sp. AU12]|uniref:sensor histidine kinase n=1 Tax=Aureimonas sp. AU12 TaxID=1638161 RepID=UPI0009EA4C2D|nr:PAS domain-containing protein [Aureimonas sp. AU12]